MDDWRRLLPAFLLPLNLCGLFLIVAAGRTPPDASVSRWAVLAAGFLLIVPSAAIMLLTLPWRDPEPEEEEDEDQPGPASPGD